MRRQNTTLLLIICCLSVFLTQLGMMMYLPALPSITLSLVTTQGLTSLALPAYLAGMAIPMLLWGKWGAIFGVKPVMMMSLLLFCISSSLLAVCSQIETFISLRFVQGMSASGISVMARSWVALHFEGTYLAKALSWLSIAFVVSLGIGQYAGVILMGALGWPFIFGCLAVGAIVLMIVVYRYLPSSSQASQPNICWPYYLAIVKHSPFLRPVLMGGLGYGIIIGFNTAAPSIFQTTYQWSADDYGRLGWMMSLAYLLGSLTVSRFASTLGRAKLSDIAIGIMLTASVGMTIGLFLSKENALLLYFPYCLIIFGQAINYPISLSEASEQSPVSGSYAMAMCGLIHQVVAALVGTAISMLGVQQPLWLATICLLLVIIILALSYFAVIGKAG